jgi:EAL domain-containing protein (putative c-di-GMP-specific phosphodiesterase class I)/FixJ family two-component response regulator
LSNRLLVLDDDPRICRLISRAAAKKGFTPYQLSDSREFAVALTTHEPDKVIVDLNMPGVDGVQLLDIMAEVGADCTIYIISGGDERLIQSTLELGARMGLRMGGGLRKPFDIAQLLEMLAKFDSNPIEKNLDRSAQASGVEMHQPNIAMLKDELPAALRKGDIVSFYQPLVSFETGHMLGAEALCRWHHEQYGLLQPGIILPLTQDLGLMSEFTLRLFERSLRDFKLWEDAGGDLYLSVNLHPSLLEDGDLPEKLAAITRTASVDCEQVCFEVTECEDYAKSIRAMNVLSRLRIKGFGLSLDDFGVGFSSMQKLHQLPFSELKIDRSFVSKVAIDAGARAIVKSALTLGQDLNLPVVAEGIASKVVWNWLKEAGCPRAQGYFSGLPGDHQSVIDLLGVSFSNSGVAALRGCAE